MINPKMSRALYAGYRGTLFLCSFGKDRFMVLKCQVSGLRRQITDAREEVFPGPLEDKEIIERLRRVFNELAFHGQPLILSLPRSKATCRFIKIPAQEEKEIEKIVALQAPRYLPYAAEELISGYDVVAVDKEGYSDVNIIIAHKEAIAGYVNIFKTLKITRAAIALSSYGLLPLAVSVKLALDEAVAVIDVDFAQSELAIILRDKLLFSRSFAIDKSAADWQGQFTNEVKKSFDAYVKESGKTIPSKIILTGVEGAYRDFAQALSSLTGIPVEALPFESLSISKKSSESIRNSSFSYSSLIGLGLAALPESINLVSAEMKVEAKKQFRRSEYARFGAFVIAIIAILAIASAKQLDNKVQYLKKLKIEVNRLSEEAKPLREIEKRIKVTSTLLREKPSGAEVFSEVYRVILPSIRLTDLIFEAGKELTLRGQAPELNAIFDFVTQLEKSAVFSKFSVKVRYATKRKVQSGEIIAFEIGCTKK